MPPLRPLTQVSILGSAVLGLALTFIGLESLISGSFPALFGLTLTAIGLMGLGLGAATWYRRRAAWAVLAATWGVAAFCAFFAAPKVVKLPKLQSVSIDMELKLGRKAAEEKVDAENLKIRFQNLGACVLFALPFGLLCAGLVAGGRELEPRVVRDAAPT